MKAALLLVAVALVAALIVVPDVATALLFGWVPYLLRVLPRMTVDRAGLAVAGAAFVLLVAGVHWLGRSVRGPAWRLGWSLAAVAGVVVAFAAGVCMIGATHQLAWLATATEPIRADGYRGRFGMYGPEVSLHMNGCGVINYASTNGDRLPSPLTAADGTPLHSWVTQILPFTSWSHQGIDLKSPWTAPHNQRYFRGVVPDLINPDLGPVPFRNQDGYGLAHYSANVHLLGAKRYRPVEVTDGTSNTLLIGEVNATFAAWGDPANLRDPARGVNRSAHGFGGPPGKRGALFATADASVRFVSETVSPAVLRALATPAGGEAVEPDVLQKP